MPLSPYLLSRKETNSLKRDPHCAIACSVSTSKTQLEWIQFLMWSLASFPGPAQLFVACSTEKLGGAWERGLVVFFMIEGVLPDGYHWSIKFIDMVNISQ